MVHRQVRLKGVVKEKNSFMGHWVPLSGATVAGKMGQDTQRGSRAFRSMEAKPVLPQDWGMFHNSSAHPHSRMHSVSVPTETFSFIIPSWVGKWKLDRQLKGTTQSIEDRFRDTMEPALPHSAHHEVTSLGGKLLFDTLAGEGYLSAKC